MSGSLNQQFWNDFKTIKTRRKTNNQQMNERTYFVCRIFPLQTPFLAPLRSLSSFDLFVRYHGLGVCSKALLDNACICSKSVDERSVVNSSPVISCRKSRKTEQKSKHSERINIRRLISGINRVINVINPLIHATNLLFMALIGYWWHHSVNQPLHVCMPKP